MRSGEPRVPRAAPDLGGGGIQRATGAVEDRVIDRAALGIRGHVGASREQREEDGMATEAYCVKCREKREMKDEKEVTMKNGRNAVEGTCPVCGTKLFRMVGKKDK